MGDVGGGAGALGDRLGGAGDGGRVQVQVADRAAAVPGGALEEAEGAASSASCAIARRPRSVTAARMLRARSGRARAAEFA